MAAISRNTTVSRSQRLIWVDSVEKLLTGCTDPPFAQYCFWGAAVLDENITTHESESKVVSSHNVFDRNAAIAENGLGPCRRRLFVAQTSIWHELAIIQPSL
jgi:hypothetical protein